MATRFVLQLGAHEIALAPGRWRVGRDPACEIRLNDDSVSREHAVFHVTADRVEVEDLGSRNGIRVDGGATSGPRHLAGGERLEFGSVAATFLDRRPSQGPSPEPLTRPLPAVGGAEGMDLLSPREREVLGRLARGLTQRAIGEELGVSVKTVETYRARISAKLGLESREDLVRFALRTGVLKDE